jgi:hypothetical protein
VPVSTTTQSLRRSRPWRRGALVAATVTAVSVLTGAPPSEAAGSYVASVPASWTPYLVSSNSTIRQLVPHGNVMYAVGTFSEVADSSGHTFARHDAFAFDATTGAVLPWRPHVYGGVYSAAVSADGSAVYLAGTFTQINKISVARLAKVSAATGYVDKTFHARANAMVSALLMHKGRLLAGGRFTSIGGARRDAMASLDPTTGAATSYLRLHIGGQVVNGGPTRVIKLVRSHGGGRLLAMGNFTTVAGHARQQIFMVNLGSTSASLNSWYSPLFSQTCKFPQYVRAAAWTPDDTKVAVADTGNKGASPLCDAAALFPASGTSAAPLWINRTGCDSLFSTAASDTTVFVAGHERWADNAKGCDYAGPGAVSRPGLGAIDSVHGLATSWNPTRSRGRGADQMLFTSRGLWIASDNFYGATLCGGLYHPGLCFFPYTS